MLTISGHSTPYIWRLSALITAFMTASVIMGPAYTLAQDQIALSMHKPSPEKSGHVQANGISYYYEIHGHGEPLLLLHGGLGTMDMFAPILPTLAANRTVIGVDLHGHGRTGLGDRAIDLVDIGDDLAVVLESLGYRHVDVMGYSFGGGAALRLAVQHPDRVRRLAVVSAGFAQDGYYPEMIEQQVQIGAHMAEMMEGTPMHESYVSVAPNPDEFPLLLDRMGDLMRRPFDWSDDVKELEMPVMLVYGDSDMFRPEHVVQFYKLLGGGHRDAGWMRENMSTNRLAILPDLTHYETFMAPDVAETVLSFLNGERRVISWADQAGH